MLRSPSQPAPERLEDLLDPALLTRLSALDVASRKVFAGKLKGERRSKRKGQSVEFADHRPYVVGDDLRRIDWNLFGRLDRLFLKLFLEEEDLSLLVVIDASESMATGEPSKFRYAQTLAAALGFIGLVNLNRVGMAAIVDPEAPGAPAPLRDLRGRRRVQEMSRWVCALRPAGGASFTRSASRLALSRRGRGVTVIISDFLFKEGYDDGLRLLAGRGHDVFAIQVLSPQEIDPAIAGDLRLKDLEDGDTAEVTISAPLLKKYRASVTAYCNRLREFCARRDIMHLTVSTETPADSLVLEVLRQRGLLR